jgi:hypothetical protein
MPRMTTRKLMMVIAILELILCAVHQGLRRPYYDERASFHGMMSDFCVAEADLMKGRADACRGRAMSDAPWDDTSDEAQDLKCCPYPWDAPRYGNWMDQAAVWERAARKASDAARRHSRACDYYNGWSPIAPPGW